MTNPQMQNEALARARGNESASNYPAIFAGFMERGIPEANIEPRVNVLTYQAWRAVGRQVRRGEKGVKVCTWITCEKKNGDDDAEPETFRRPKTAHVFHISQTDAAD